MLEKKSISFINLEKSENTFNLLRSIHKEAMFDSVKSCLGEWNDEVQKKRLKKHFDESYRTLNFIKLKDEIIGTINCRKKEFEDGNFYFVEQFYLLKNFQGKGIGSFILDEKLGKEETRLSVLKNDLKTHQFYFKNGFEEYFEDEYQKYLKKVKK